MVSRKRTGWREHLRRQRRVEQYQASIEADMIAAKLQVRLPKEVWEAIEAEWQAKPDTQAYLPTQRLDYLIAKASMHDALDIVPLSAFGG